MKKQFYAIKSFKWVVVGCFLSALTFSCSVGLHHQQVSLAKTKSYPSLVEIYTDKLQPMPDSLHTIVALTPMTGENVDSLFKGGDKFVIQYPTDLNQAVPAGIDVLYLNADYATQAMNFCGLLDYATSNDNIKIMIDGSVKNIEKFCKVNFNIYNPKSELMVYQNVPPDSSAESDIPYGASSTMAYGKKYNHISYDMLIESIFDFSVNDKRTVEDFGKAFEYEYDPNSPETIAGIARMEALRKQYAQNKPKSVLNPIELDGSSLLLASKADDISSLFPNNETPKLSNSSSASFTYDEGPYCDWNRWSNDRFNHLWNYYGTEPIWAEKWQLESDLNNDNSNYVLRPNGKLTHIINPGEYIVDKTFYRGYYKSSNEYGNGSVVRWPLRRVNCIDYTGYFSSRIEKTWVPYKRLDNPVWSLLKTSQWVCFDTKKSRNGYLDFGVTSISTSSYGLTRTGGIAFSSGGDVAGFSIERTYENSWSKSKSQDETIQLATNYELWSGNCMHKVSNPICGQLRAQTKTVYGDAKIAVRMRMVYADQRDYGNTRALQFELLDDKRPRYQGVMRHANSFWIDAIWKRNTLASSPLIKSFADCGKPRPKPKYY